jgi:hypothetical protein
MLTGWAVTTGAEVGYEHAAAFEVIEP